ncbi:MAG: hypothetical protein JW722_08070 [Demequinaceae bacterium]|nr:hypothetical protein [Demequinaceae bacterium]
MAKRAEPTERMRLAERVGRTEQTGRIERAVWGRWATLVAFGVGFGYVEAAVVHYLREIIGGLSTDIEVAKTYLDLGFIAFVQPERSVLVDPGLTRVETVREAATILMLGAVAWIAATTWRRRVAAFFVAFTVWDLTYYLFLWVLNGWPTSVMDRDVFFLIPVAWVGPVLTALVASALVLVAASTVYLRSPHRV